MLKAQIGCVNRSYVPDVIIAHPGWGVALLGDIWPDTPQIHYVEFSYRKKGTDTDFPDKFNVKPDLFDNSRGRMKNANVLQSRPNGSRNYTDGFFSIQHYLIGLKAKLMLYTMELIPIGHVLDKVFLLE